MAGFLCCGKAARGVGDCTRLALRAEFQGYFRKEVLMESVKRFILILALVSVALLSAKADGNTNNNTNFPDDTHICLTTYGGPLVTVSGIITSNTSSDSGYYFNSTQVMDETRFDARDALFLLGPVGDSQAEGVAWNFWHAPEEGNSICVAGGVYQGVYDRTISWDQAHHGDGMLAYLTAPDITLDGLRVDNMAQDALNLTRNIRDFLVINSWFSYVRDDCIENDYRFSGRIADNLYDGCYTFLSHQDESSRDGSADLVVIEDNLIRIQNMPKPYDYQNYGNDPESVGHGAVFKQATGSNKPQVDILRNVFWVEPNLTPRLSLRPEVFEVELGVCEDNILIWTGEDEWPDPTWEELPAGCITEVFRGSVGLKLWEAIRQNWIDCHPEVGRAAGDPASDPTQCVPDAYGGGQGGIALPFVQKKIYLPLISFEK